MDAANWINALNELLKCCLIIWGILGYSFNKRYNVKNLLLFVGVSCCFFYCIDLGRLSGGLLVAIVFIGIFVDGSVMAKIKSFLVAEVVTAIGDMFLLSFCGAIIPEIYLIDVNILNLNFDLFWVLLFWFLYRYRNLIHEYFVNLSLAWTVLLVSILLGTGLVAGSTQYILDIGVTAEIKRFIMLAQTMATILIAIGGVILCYHIVTKSNMQFIMEKEREKYLLEKKVYEERFRKNEEIQKFRHDMKKHMKIIHQLCGDLSQKDAQTERLKEYVNDFLDNYPEQITVYTGNVISDYFISELIFKLSQNSKFQYNIIGKLPETIPVSDTDLSIILGNALDNAADELIQIEGECYFEITFKNYNGHLMINIKNTKANPNARKKKEPADGHGYGIKNMREVVKRYNGTLEVIETEDDFSVDIFI